MDTKTFLRTVITTPEGWFCLAHSNGSHWKEEWFEWPRQIDEIIAEVEARPEENVFFSAHLFSQASSQKKFALPSKTIQADLDNADVLTLPIVPTILIESSPNRYQGFWVLQTVPDLDVLEILSRKLTYAIPKCDRSGWSIGHRLRVPESFNHKYLEGPQLVQIVGASLQTYAVEELELLPEAPKQAVAEFDDEWVEGAHTYTSGPLELLESIRSTIPLRVYVQYSTLAKDRSATLWALMCAAFRANLDRDAVFWLAKNSANNKFESLAYHGDRELAKDVLRAEQVVKNRVTDLRTAVLEARRLSGINAEKRQYIQQIVLEAMRKAGEFVKTSEDTIWYINREQGRPMTLSQNSEYLQTYLDLQFGLNATEVEQSFVIAGIIAYAHSLPPTATVASLCYYDSIANMILLHTGRKDVIRITIEGVSTVTNGAYGVIFPWNPVVEAFKPRESGVDWAQELFTDCLTNVISCSKEEAFALLKVWVLFLLFRNAAVSKPILALFGQPGAGKSTLFRRVYAFLYGPRKSLGAVTIAEDFDHSVANDPLLVLDNVDSWERWLPDRLALAASSSDITKRKLYTDQDTIVLKRQALIGLTAHNPRFGREDVADRMLILIFERLSHFLPEEDIIRHLVDARDFLWSSLIEDIEKVLREPMPMAIEVPQFRVADFARIGLRIARALGIEIDFVAAITSVTKSQKSFSLGEEQLLVTAIQNYVLHRKGDAEFTTTSALWTQLELYAPDPLSFTKLYHNAVLLGKKLWALNSSLREVLDVEWRLGPEGTRLWRFAKKEQIDG
jgi:hypothetical protein